MRNCADLTIGADYAYYRVLRKVTDSIVMDMRTYQVQTLCCGTVSERTERAIKDAVRKERQHCQVCRWAGKRIVIGPLQRIGPILILGPGDGPETWRVRWDCCGREAVLGEGRVRNIRNLTRKKQPTVCRHCAKNPYDDEACMVVDNDVIEDEEPTFHSGTGNLPPGLVSAALAWPRPRLLARDAR